MNTYTQDEANAQGIRTITDTGTVDEDGNKIGTVNTAAAAAYNLGANGTGTATDTAAAISATIACVSVLLINTHATATLLFGNVSGQVSPLAPGANVPLPTEDAALIYVKRRDGVNVTFAFQTVV
jgi:hypothetical protein